MDKENILYIQNGVLLSHKEEWNHVVCRKMDGTGDQHVEQDMIIFGSENQIFYVFIQMWM
jgi:hypothetical protein